MGRKRKATGAKAAAPAAKAEEAPEQQPEPEQTAPVVEQPEPQEEITVSKSDVIDRLKASGCGESKVEVLKEVLPSNANIKIADVQRELAKHPNGGIVGRGTLEKIRQITRE